MAGTWSETLEDLRRRLIDLVDAIGEALAPAPEPVPVPVRGNRRRPRNDRH